MSIYTEPRSVSDLKDCYFYHTMDLPGIGKIEGNWDLRPNLHGRRKENLRDSWWILTLRTFIIGNELSETMAI
jgi:hypothetical protein